MGKPAQYFVGCGVGQGLDKTSSLFIQFYAQMARDQRVLRALLCGSGGATPAGVLIVLGIRALSL